MTTDTQPTRAMEPRVLRGGRRQIGPRTDEPKKLYGSAGETAKRGAEAEEERRAQRVAAQEKRAEAAESDRQDALDANRVKDAATNAEIIDVHAAAQPDAPKLRSAAEAPRKEAVEKVSRDDGARQMEGWKLYADAEPLPEIAGDEDDEARRVKDSAAAGPAANAQRDVQSSKTPTDKADEADTASSDAPTHSDDWILQPVFIDIDAPVRDIGCVTRELSDLSGITRRNPDRSVDDDTTTTIVATAYVQRDAAQEMQRHFALRAVPMPPSLTTAESEDGPVDSPSDLEPIPETEPSFASAPPAAEEAPLLDPANAEATTSHTQAFDNDDGAEFAKEDSVQAAVVAKDSFASFDAAVAEDVSIDPSDAESSTAHVHAPADDAVDVSVMEDSSESAEYLIEEAVASGRSETPASEPIPAAPMYKSPAWADVLLDAYEDPVVPSRGEVLHAAVEDEVSEDSDAFAAVLAEVREDNDAFAVVLEEARQADGAGDEALAWNDETQAAYEDLLAGDESYSEENIDVLSAQLAVDDGEGEDG